LEKKITIGDSSDDHENKPARPAPACSSARNGRVIQLKTRLSKAVKSKLDGAAWENAAQGI
jgi:hypothetical protein